MDKIHNKVKQIDLKKAFYEKDLGEFLKQVFPPSWESLAARIIESGARYRSIDNKCPDRFAPRWTEIPFTVRHGKTYEETYFKSIIFRVHDCLHQLWGLPIPKDWSNKSRSYFKRMWMCAEISVLTIVEFEYCQWLYDTQEHVRSFLVNRNTLLFKATCFQGKTLVQIATRLDELLHKQTVPDWVRENEYARKFVADFVPMLAQDRVNIDHDWNLLYSQAISAAASSLLETTSSSSVSLCDNPEGKISIPSYIRGVPHQTYGPGMDGLEMTLWMINDFLHLQHTGCEIDYPLAEFNAKRRENVESMLPNTWNEAPVQFEVYHTPKLTPKDIFK